MTNAASRPMGAHERRQIVIGEDSPLLFRNDLGTLGCEDHKHDGTDSALRTVAAVPESGVIR
jgi:hypothetical protein